MRAIDVVHKGQEKVICCWEVDGVLIDPGPGISEDDAAGGAGRASCPRALLLTHIHFDHAGVTGSLVQALARHPGLRARARRAAHGRPRAARRQRRAAVRRRRGPARAVGRDAAGARGEPARADRRRDRHRGRVPGRVHARPRLPPRLLLPRALGLGVRRRHGRRPHPAARLHGRADAAAGHRRRGLGALDRDDPRLEARPASASRTSARSRTRTPSSTRCLEALHAQVALEAEHDEAGFVAAMAEPASTRRSGPTRRR